MDEKTAELLKQAFPKRARHGGTRTQQDGHIFDSNGEVDRYGELRVLLAAGRIRDLEVHPRIELFPEARDHGGRKISAIAYTPDFCYYEILGKQARFVVEEIKAPARYRYSQTPTGRLGKKRVYDGAKEHGYAMRVNLFRRAFPFADFRELRR